MENEKPDRPSQRSVVIRSREKDYDALQAERTIRDFCAFIRSVIARFDENQHQQDAAEARRMDLQHCIEMTEALTEEEEHQLYSKLSESFRTRRICKYENLVMKPLYDAVADKNLLNRLAQIQGQIGTAKKTIAEKSYSCRTDVLDDFRPDTTVDKEQAQRAASICQM